MSRSNSLFTALLVIGLLVFPSRSSDASEYFSFQVDTVNPRAFETTREEADAILTELANRLGAPDEVLAEPTIEVTITSDREAFRQAQQHLSSVDNWAAGTAYPAQDKIFLSLDAHDFFTKEEIAVHEIAHIAVYRAAGRSRLPRWFEEGIAIYLADQELHTRIQAMAAASFFRSPPDLEEYTRRFPSASGEARLAYATGALFIADLAIHENFEKKMPILFHSLRNGTPFTEAFRRAMGNSLTHLEGNWKQRLNEQNTWLAVFSDGEVIWTLVGFLFVLTCGVGYRRKKNAIAAMPGEDEPDTWPPTGLVR